MTDKHISKQSMALLRGAMCATEKALPNTDPELIGGFFADLLDLWETGQTLDKKLNELVALRFPEDRDKLYDFLIWISAIQVDMGLFWTRGIRKDLPKLLRALDRLERRNAGKQKRTGRSKRA